MFQSRTPPDARSRRALSRASVALMFLGMMLYAPLSEACLDATISPVLEAYNTGEPIVLSLIIRNLGEVEVELPFSYPQYVGVVLWSNDPNAGGPPHLRIGATGLPARSLHPGGTLQRLIALNRHVTLHTPGQYTISYQMLGRREATNSAVACQTAKQKQFQIILNSGKPREEVIQNYIDGLHSGVMPRVEESAEMLVWTRDVAVIASLGAAAGHVPTLSFDIARALEEFLQNPEGPAALLEVMVVGDVYGRIHGFRLFDEHALTVPAS